MDRFLDSHPEIAEQLRKDPSLVNNAKFLHNHPALQTYLQQNPGVHEEIMENPSAFMQQEQGFEGQEHTFNRQAVVTDHDTTRGQLASMDRFLDHHPEIAERLQKDPSLVNNKDFVKNHPDLQSYLQQHPGVNEEFTENPNAFMRQEQRFDRREDFDRGRGFELRNNGGFERGEAASFGEFLGTHGTMAAQISKDPNLVNNKEFMATLAKGLTVLGAFGGQRPAMTLSEAAEVAGLSRATARRVLRTLSMLGYVEQDGRMFSLSRGFWISVLPICQRKAGSTARCR